MVKKSPAIFVVHAKAQALDALNAASRAGRPVLLLSGKGAGAYAGPGWFAALVESALVESAATRRPSALSGAILDCGNDAGAVLAAIRAGVGTISFAGPAAARRRLNEIATVKGVSILARGTLWRRALDLDRIAARQRSKACADWIAIRPKRR